MLSFLRVIKFALQDISRNMSLSVMTVLILVLMLLSINTVVIIRAITNRATQEIKSRLDVSVYFDKNATDAQIEETKKYIQSFPEVTEIVFYTKEQVLEQFKQKYSGNSEIMSSLDELNDNPLGATIIIKTREPGDYKKIIDSLSVPEYENIIESKTFEDTQKAIDKIDSIMWQVERFSMFLSSFFAIIAFIIIFNTIRVAIYTQRIEISIKKLVGATNWFIRGPYLIESFIFSILSASSAYLLVLLVCRFLDPYLQIIFEDPNFLFSYFIGRFAIFFSAQFVIVLFLTMFSSFVAMRRHLKV
jgi:cell division transport system permease protein